MKVYLVMLLLLSTELLYSSSWTEAAEREFTSWNGSSDYKALTPIYRQAFLGDLPHYIKVSDGQSADKPKQDVYIGEEIISVRSLSGGWNVFANGKQTYAWKEGETVGIVAGYNPKELINYLLGVLSPCQFLSGFYVEHLEYPKKYTKVDKKETVEYTRIASDFLPITIIYQKSPPWLSGFKVTNPERGDHFEFSVSYPKNVPKIPPQFSAPPPNIEFHDGVIPWQRELIPYL